MPKADSKLRKPSDLKTANRMEKANRNPNPLRIIELDNPDLPIVCPNTETPGLLMHPQVYLKITSDGTCRCPYCSTLYIIRSFSV